MDLIRLSREFSETEGPKGKCISKKEQNQSKVSAECIRHLTNQIRQLTEENKVYKEEMTKYREEIDRLLKKTTTECTKCLNLKNSINLPNLEQFQSQIKKINSMNEVLRKQIESFQKEIMKENLKKDESDSNSTLQNREFDYASSTAKNITEYYQNYLAEIINEKGELEKKLADMENMKHVHKRLEDKYKNLKIEVYRLKKELHNVKHVRKHSRESV